MAWQYHPLLLAFLVGGLVSLGVAAYAIRYLRRYGSSYLVGGIALLGLADAVWIGAAGLKTASAELQRSLLFYKLEFVGSWAAPALGVVIALAFVGRDHQLTRRTLAGIGAIPLMGIILVILNPGSIMIVDPVLIPVGGVLAFEHVLPPLFLLFLFGAVTTATAVAAVFAVAALRQTSPTRPAVAGAIAFVLPVVFVVLKVVGVYPPGGRGINLTPVINGVAISVLAVAVVRYRFLEVLPIGRDRAVEIMPDGYLLVDPDGTILDSNRAAAELLTEQGSGSITGDGVGAYVPNVGQLTEESSAEERRFARHGRVLEARSAPVRRQRQPVGRLLLVQDVTEQQRRQRELERTNERLDQFASVVSHDLRNPLSVASGRVDLARGEEDSEHLVAAATALDRMESLIDDVLRLAREGREIGTTESIQLESVADTCWEVVSKGEASLVVEGGLAFRADPEQLQRLLENLLRNAIEHGGDAVTIRVGALAESRGFYVADDGPGIPDGDRERVLEFGNSDRGDGHGLGLGIVDAIATAHGWEVTIAESVDGGTRVEIRGVEQTD